MSLIFISSKIDKQTKEIFLNALFSEISNCSYLNIDTLTSAFKHPAESSYILQYNEMTRITKPGHKVIIELAIANLNLGKTVIIDGNFNPELINEYLNTHSLTKQQVKLLSLLMHNVIDLPRIENLIEVNVTDTQSTIQEKVKQIIPELQGTPVQAKVQSKPVLAMSAGLACAGKTTSCAEIAKRIPDSVLLPKDIIGLNFLESVGLDMQSPYYTTHIKNQTYQALFALAEENLTFGNSAIIDGWFGDKLKEPWLQEHLGATAYTTTLIYFHCTGATQLERIKIRNAQRDAAKLADFVVNRRLDLQAHLGDFAQLTEEGILFVDTEHAESFEDSIIQLVNHLTPALFRSLNTLQRETPFNPISCTLNPNEGMGNLQEFKNYLTRVKNWDRANSDRLFKLPRKKAVIEAKDDFDLQPPSSSKDVSLHR